MNKKFDNYQKLVKEAEELRKTREKKAKKEDLFEVRSKRISNPRTLREKEIHLSHLERLQDDDDVALDRSTQKEIERLRQQIYKPTIRQRLFGFRPGRLRTEDQEFLDVMIIMDEMKDTIDKFITDHPPHQKECANE